MRAVNLLPPRDRRSYRHERERSVTVFGAVAERLPLIAFAGAVFVATVLVGLYLTQSGKVDEKRETLETLQRQVVAQRTPSRQPGGDPAAPRLAALTSAASTRVAWDRVLWQFSLVIPSNVVAFTALTATAPTATAAASTPVSTPGTATAFVVDGYTRSQEDVARLLSRLALVPTLTNVQLQKTELTEQSGRPVIHFVMAADIAPAGRTG